MKLFAVQVASGTQRTRTEECLATPERSAGLPADQVRHCAQLPDRFYARYTKTKPLKDIDIFFVLKDSEKHYHGKAASVVLDDFHSALVEKYGSAAVRKQARSISVDFGVHIDAEDNTDYRVVSVDAVPAFDTGDQYEIPDTASGKWIKTDPESIGQGDRSAPSLWQ